jgi:hypothetical protein
MANWQFSNFDIAAFVSCQIAKLQIAKLLDCEIARQLLSVE